MKYEFKVNDHLELPGKQVVECWRDGIFVAAIYPHKDGIRVISKYMTGVYQETLETPVNLPAAVIKLASEP